VLLNTSMRPAFLLALIASFPSVAHAQTSGPQFDVVSIKRHMDGEPGMDVRAEPNGATTMSNVPMALALTRALPVPLRDISGLPDWVISGRERYDIVVKPPDNAGPATIEGQRAMWRAMVEDRMKLTFHVEQRERDVYKLVIARSDGKLGPQLAPSTLDCKSLGLSSSSAQQPSVEFFQKHCGMGATPTTTASGGVTIDQLGLFLANIVVAAVDNRTGLDGLYAFTLTFSPQRRAGPPVSPNSSDDLPDIFTAVQEQLGLKLQRGKKMTPVYVIDHIERPSEN
jgi:uncharacterized protein (TIGR03435 family)